MVLWRVVVILILVLVSVSVLGSCYHRIGSRSSTWILGRFVYMDCFGSFYTGVFLSSGFSPIVSSLYQQVLFTDPFAFLLEFTFFIPWSHGVCFLFFWLCFFSYFLVLLEEFFVRWNYRQLLVGSKQQGFRIPCVVVLFFIFLRGFMILSSSVLDSLSLLSCKNSVLLWFKWCSSTISN